MSFVLINGTWEYSLVVRALKHRIASAKLLYDQAVKHFEDNGFTPFKFRVATSEIVDGAVHNSVEEYQLVNLSKINRRFSKNGIFSSPVERKGNHVRMREQSPSLQIQIHMHEGAAAAWAAGGCWQQQPCC